MGATVLPASSFAMCTYQAGEVAGSQNPAVKQAVKTVMDNTHVTDIRAKDAPTEEQKLSAQTKATTKTAWVQAAILLGEIGGLVALIAGAATVTAPVWIAILTIGAIAWGLGSLFTDFSVFTNAPGFIGGMIEDSFKDGVLDDMKRANHQANEIENEKQMQLACGVISIAARTTQEGMKAPR